MKHTEEVQGRVSDEKSIRIEPFDKDKTSSGGNCCGGGDGGYLSGGKS